MIKWLLTGLEDAYSGDTHACSMWDSLELEAAPSWCSPAPQWDDTPPPVLAITLDDDLLSRNCMWGGRCGSHDHGAPPSCASRRPPPAARAEPPPVKPRAGESLLKSSVLLRSQQPSPPPSPPPEAEAREVPDSEKEMVFVSMTDVLSEVRWTACPAPQPPPCRPAPGASALQVHEDHSYHLTRHSRPSLRLDNLGVQTPSDSGTDDDFFEDEIMELPDLDPDDVDFFGPESVFKDIAESVVAELRPIKQEPVSESESAHRMSESEEEEEIDVVSVAVEKARTLPTNPSVRDCHELQQTVADAVGRRGRCHHHHRHHHHHRRHHHHHRRRRGRPGRKPKRRRLVEVASDADDSEGGCDKRSLHNDMERQRRIDLSNLVRSVRQLVPSICEKDRAPRIVVLREAAHYCRQLQVESKQLADYKQELLRINNKLHRMHRLALHNLPTQSLRSLHSHHSNKPRRSKDSHR